MINEQSEMNANNSDTLQTSNEVKNPLSEDELAKLQSDLNELENERWDLLIKPLRIEKEGNAIKIATATASGAIDVIKSVAQRGRLPAHYKVPNVLIKDTNDGHAKYSHNLMQYDDGRLEVVDSEIKIPPTYLQGESERNLSLPYSVQVKRGLIEPLDINVGTPEEIAYTTGAEEAAHSIFAHHQAAKGIIGSSETFAPQNARSVHEYDATDVEYHGLGWQVRALLDKAERLNDSDSVENSQAVADIQKQVNVLKYRIKKAAEFRSKKI